MDEWVRIFPGFPRVHRFGLATRGDTHLTPEDVYHAFSKGLHYWNWCGYEDGLSETVRTIGKDRDQVLIATQIQSTNRESLLRELESLLKMLGTDRLDVVTLYYLESRKEWDRIKEKGGVLETLESMKSQGIVGKIGITSHQRRLAAEIAASGETELLMIRYNAAHRGAEQDVFPVTDPLGIPVVAYTCLRWGELLRPHVNLSGFDSPPSAVDCYRFVLSNPSVSVALMAPDTRRELEENLTLLEDWKPLSEAALERMKLWGDHVRKHAGSFP